MVSHYFYPSVGGTETVTEMFANEMTHQGHLVKVVTETPINFKSKDKGFVEQKTFPYDIVRNPSKREFFELVKWCDVLVHQQISLKFFWPLFVLRRPWILVYHGPGYPNNWNGRVKHFMSHFAHNIVVSNFSARKYHLRHYKVIHNAYDNNIFKQTNFGEREGFVFVGKVCYSKGCDILLRAWDEFCERHAEGGNLLLIGGGAQTDEIKAIAEKMRHRDRVSFYGFAQKEKIVELLNERRVMCVPSTGTEAFGLVVIEGMACGCTMIGNDSDGVEEALGGCGYTFKCKDWKDLLDKMEQAYFNHKETLNIELKRKQWLESRSLENVVKEYIEEFYYLT